MAGCAVAVNFAWVGLEGAHGALSANWVGLALSFLIVIAYALLLPEPSGYANAGKMRVTLAEWIFGFFNAFLVYGLVLGFRAGVGSQ